VALFRSLGDPARLAIVQRLAQGGRGAARWGEVSFALEDCRHLTRRLERDLLGAGQRVVRVPTRLMVGGRRGGRQPGKSDTIDAEAVALAALRNDGLRSPSSTARPGG
jgi:transposase